MTNALWPATLVAILACALATGCKRSAGNGAASTTKDEGAATVLRAEPNPVPLGAGKGPASTTLTWSTADGSFSQVYVSLDGGPEKLVVEGKPGTKTIKWIYSKVMYEFRLYKGKDHKTLLATIQVTRN